MSTEAPLPEDAPRSRSSGGPEPTAREQAAVPHPSDWSEQVQARYAISVVSSLVGTGQQNIRLYETRGLLTPHRTPGGTRQYSDRDVAVLLRISELLEEGLNLAGVAKVLELEAANAKLRSDLKRVRSRLRKQSRQ